MEPLHFEERARFTLSPAELWPFVADTQRLNRSIGLPEAHFAHTPRTDGGSLATGAYRQLGITISRWREHPFAFVKPRGYTVLREYDIGPFTRVDGGAELTPMDGGTELRVHAEITPRNLVGWLMCKLLVGPRSTRRVIARCRRYEQQLRRGTSGSALEKEAQLMAAAEAYSGAPPRFDRTRLEQSLRRLLAEGTDEPIARHLGEHLATASDEGVASMRPFELADLWGTDRRATLIAFLEATSAGMLTMSWDILCPYCRVPKSHASSLSDLTAQGHCESCNITFDANFDRLVEVRFKPAAAIRDVAVGTYCIGGPQNQPHVVAQQELGSGETIAWELPLETKSYRLRSPQSGAAILEVRTDGEQAASVALTAGNMAPPLLAVAAQVALRVESQLAVPAVVALEEQFWPDTAATAALVSTIQEFRDLFSSEVLAPGLQVAIERLGVLFTDLAGSTALYERVGQARAFRLVQDHFQLLEDAIRAHQGAMIKTIGDAVMAVFPSAHDAVAAAIAMQCGMRGLSVPEGLDAARLLKIGIHAGPCLAVNLNDRLDYFGTAVNIAARAQHEAAGGEIIVTAAVHRDEGVAEALEAVATAIQNCEVRFKGITESVPLYRVLGVGCVGDGSGSATL